MNSKLGTQSVYPSVASHVASFAVVGSHPTLGSGVLYWLSSRHQADHNATAVRMNGGTAQVETAATALADYN